MSKLKYLSRSVTTNNDKLTRRKQQTVELPKNTGVTIMEAASEEDSDESPTKITDQENADKETTTSPQDLALEVINELINIVLESAGEYKTLDPTEVVSNALLQQNVHRLHKQVFVKVKVGDNPQMNAATGTKVSDSVDYSKLKAFKSRKSAQ